MDVNTIYNLIQYICSKNIQQGFVSPKDFNTIINQAQTSYLNYLLGDFQKYQPNHPQSTVEIGVNGIVRQRLMPLIKESTLTINGSGTSPYPNSYEQVDAMYTTTYSKIRYVQQNYLPSYLNSTIDPVATNPIYLMKQSVLQFYPHSLGSAIISYVSTPPTIVWAYTLDGNGRPVYDPTNSVSPVWFDVDILDIVSRALQLVGVSLQSGQISNFANQIKAGGQ